MKCGYVFEEKYLWHHPGTLSFSPLVEPAEHWENPETKRRFHSLLSVSGLTDSLIPIRARRATKEEVLRFHTEEYHDKIEFDSKKPEGGCGGEHCRFAEGGYDIALLSAGGLLAALEAMVAGKIDNAYCLVRPPGHHAVANQGMGFCIFNNVVLAAKHARTLPGVNIQRVAIVDYDVHHGNGTQDAFWDDPNTLFISLHQHNNYPVHSGAATDMGGEGALGSTVNIPLPPGTGHGAYLYAFETIVLPSLRRFQPDLIIVSSGFDANFSDPLGSMLLHSETYRYMTSSMLAVAQECCAGRILFAHEGGYSKDYVPFCGLAVVEALSGVRTAVKDPYLAEASEWGYQDCQPHQRRLIDGMAKLHNLPVTTSIESGLNGEEQTLLAELKKLLVSSSGSSSVDQSKVVEALLHSL